MFNIFRF